MKESIIVAGGHYMAFLGIEIVKKATCNEFYYWDFKLYSWLKNSYMEKKFLAKYFGYLCILWPQEYFEHRL